MTHTPLCRMDITGRRLKGDPMWPAAPSGIAVAGPDDVVASANPRVPVCVQA
jgi:hypothetical protein